MDCLAKDFYFIKLTKDQLPELLEFYLYEIYEHFNFTDYTSEFAENELAHLMEEDLSFFKNSIYYVLREHRTDKIVASIKTTYWDRVTTLPIQKLFSINPNAMSLSDRRHFWHIGRFVVSRSVPRYRISILKKLLFNAFYPVHAMEKGVIFAECDRKVMNTLLRMGIRSAVLGQSIDYICSDTVPIYINSEWLNTFITTSINRYYCVGNWEDYHHFSSKKEFVKQKFA
jgi:hypothetical protein